MKTISHFKSKSFNQGFTLIEIMFVVMLVSILGGYATLSVRRIIPQLRADKASSRLSFQLQLARSEAMASNKMSQMTLDPATNIFTSWIDLDSDSVQDADELTEVVIIEPENVTMTTDWESGLFNAFGQFILTPGQREIRTVTTKFSPEGSDYEVELILRGSGAITKR